MGSVVLIRGPNGQSFIHGRNVDFMCVSTSTLSSKRPRPRNVDGRSCVPFSILIKLWDKRFIIFLSFPLIHALPLSLALYRFLRALHFSPVFFREVDALPLSVASYLF